MQASKGRGEWLRSTTYASEVAKIDGIKKDSPSGLNLKPRLTLSKAREEISLGRSTYRCYPFLLKKERTCGSTWGICTRRTGKLYKARSRLYRSQCLFATKYSLEKGSCWKSLDEIYTIQLESPSQNPIRKSSTAVAWPNCAFQHHLKT